MWTGTGGPARAASGPGIAKGVLGGGPPPVRNRSVDPLPANRPRNTHVYGHLGG